MTKTKLGTREQWIKLGLKAKQTREALFEVARLAQELTPKTDKSIQRLHRSMAAFDDFKNYSEEVMFKQIGGIAETNTFYGPLTEEQKKLE